MLNYNVRGENIEVTDAIRSYIEKKIGKLEKYFQGAPDTTAHVNLKVYPDKSAKVEVTIQIPSLVLRAEVTSTDLYASVDAVTDKLVRQIGKYKTKINRKQREKGYKGIDLVVPADDAGADAPIGDDNELQSEIVRTKQISLKPMNSQEAVLQMNLLGHDFFIFEDADTNGTSIVYKRHDGRYGLIETNE